MWSEAVNQRCMFNPMPSRKSGSTKRSNDPMSFNKTVNLRRVTLTLRAPSVGGAPISREACTPSLISRTLLSLGVVGIGAFPLTVRAEADDPSCQIGASTSADCEAAPGCDVRVRLLQGVHTEGENPSATQGLPSKLKGFQHISLSAGEPSLADIRSQLEVLPYEHFRVVSREEQRTTMGEQVEFRLQGGEGETHTVSVVPQSIRGKRVKLGVAWEGPGGTELVQSQLAVENGKSIVVGADEPRTVPDEQRSLVVCVTMRCDH